VTFLLGFGLSFQLPILIFFLARLGIVTDKQLSRNRKYAVLLIFVVAAVLTPSPDALSQVLMAIPLIFLYEVSIFVAKFAARKKEAPKSSEGEPEA
jgi:sec-independent protein translocase protein TatC